MTQPSLGISGGSYDDLPEIEVATSLTVPIRLPGAPEDSRAPLVRAPEPVAHAGRHRGAQTTTVNRAPARHRRNSPTPVATLTAASGPVHAVLKIGLPAALLVFAATTVGLLVITWLVR